MADHDRGRDLETEASQTAERPPDAGKAGLFWGTVPIDGSAHAWFEDRGPKCILLVYIDDATGQLLELWFVPTESFFGYCEATRHLSGQPGAIVRFEQWSTQFGRVMQELDIQTICANSPQAKGR